MGATETWWHQSDLEHEALLVWWKLALQCQDGSNLSGIVSTFASAVRAVWELAHKQGYGTEWVNGHPICILFADKLAGLSGSADHVRFSRAYQAAKDVVHKAAVDAAAIAEKEG